METISILLVEDNPVDARLVKDALRETQGFTYRLDQAENYKDAVKLLDKNPFHLVLLDLNLPDSTGKETFTKMRKLYPHVPVVVFTDYIDEMVPFEILQEGIEIYLIKGRTDAGLLKKNLEYALGKIRDSRVPVTGKAD